MPEKIRVGIVGAGGNTRAKHIPGLLKIDGVEIISVCNRSIESGRKVADQFGIPKVCSHWAEVVGDVDIDAVVIGTWPYMHQPVTTMALAEGKHVMVEARMAMNALEAREMLQASRLRPDLVAQVVPSPFTLKFDRTINELIADGYLGEIYAIDLRGVVNTFADLESPITWRQDIELSGLNTLAMGIWYEAMARWVGQARKVTAMRKVCVKQRPHPDGGCVSIAVPDHVDALAEMECGAQARMQFSAVTGLASPKSGAWLYGSQGTLLLDADNGRLLGGRRGDAGLKEIPIPPEKQGAWRVEEEFINAIRGVEPIRLTTFDDGVRYMEFTEAVALSADNGHAVSLPMTG